MVNKRISDKIDQLVNRSEKLKTLYYEKVYSDMNFSASDRMFEVRSEFDSFKTSCVNFISKIAGEDSGYLTAINERVSGYDIAAVENLNSILKEVKQEFKDGFLGELRTIISSEIFSDYLEMAEHLLENNYKDPAAVIIGSTLENFLKEQCKKNSIPTEIANFKGKMIAKKASVINVDLVKGRVYNTMSQKQVTSWLDIRNNAAHGNYAAYNLEDVKNMLEGVKNFMIKYD